MYILDVQYIYLMSDIYIRRPIYMSDVGYPCPSPCPSPSPWVLYIRRWIDIGRLILILDVRYIYWTSNIDFGNIGVILSQMAPHNDGHSSFLGFSEFEIYSTISSTKLIRVILNSYQLATC